MANVFFNKKKYRSCSCCAHAEEMEYSGEILCAKKGVCDKRDFCRHFKYDILKRVPERIKATADYSAEDFKIE